MNEVRLRVLRQRRALGESAWCVCGQMRDRGQIPDELRRNEAGVTRLGQVQHTPCIALSVLMTAWRFVSHKGAGGSGQDK